MHAADAWQTAMATLLLVAERDGPNAVAGASLDRDKLHEAKFTEELMLYCATL